MNEEDRKTLREAAAWLNVEAKSLKQSHTLADGVWDTGEPIDVAAKLDYDDMRRMARELKRIASEAR